MADMQFDLQAHVATLTLQGADVYNRLSRAQAGELRRRLLECDANPQVRVVVLRGGGGEHFSLGFEQRLPDPGLEKDAFWYPTDQDDAALFGFRLSTPVIAAIRGVCLDEALCLVGCHASLRIASTSAQFGFPRVRLGHGGAVGVRSRLARQIPHPTLMRMIATGLPIDAPSALRVGLVAEVVDNERLIERAYEVAELVCQRPKLLVRAEKEGLARAEQMTPKQAATMASALALLSAAGAHASRNGTR